VAPVIVRNVVDWDGLQAGIPLSGSVANAKCSHLGVPYQGLLLGLYLSCARVPLAAHKLLCSTEPKQVITVQSHMATIGKLRPAS